MILKLYNINILIFFLYNSLVQDNIVIMKNNSRK